MIPSKTKFTEFKSKALQFSKCTDAGVYMLLFLKTFISLMGDKHHSHPVISGVTRNLFRATATYKFHNFYDSCRTFTAHISSGAPRATKKGIIVVGKKIAFHLRVLHYHFRPCSIQAISIKMLERNGILRPKKVGRNVYCYYNEE